MGGSYSNQRSVSAVANDRMILDQIREEGPTFRGRFLGRWGDEIEAEWRNRGRFYVDPRRAVSYPELEDDALVFSIFCIFTYKLHEREPDQYQDFTFPPLDEVIELMRSHREEIRRIEVILPSYVLISMGVYSDLVLGGS